MFVSPRVTSQPPTAPRLAPRSSPGGIPDIHRRIFAALLAQLDDSIGTVLSRLHETGLERDTLVVFLSDNGGATRELTSSNAPLRGEKGSLFEGGVRVPMIIRWPARIPTARVVESPVISMDTTATALAAARIHPNPASDGIDLIPFLAAHAEPPSDRAFFWRAGPRGAIRVGQWKLLREPAGGEPGRWQLYHLDHDIGEKTDLATKEPARVAELAERWNRWSADQSAPMW